MSAKYQSLNPGGYYRITNEEAFVPPPKSDIVCPVIVKLVKFLYFQLEFGSVPGYSKWIVELPSGEKCQCWLERNASPASPLEVLGLQTE